MSAKLIAASQPRKKIFQKKKIRARDWDSEKKKCVKTLMCLHNVYIDTSISEQARQTKYSIKTAGLDEIVIEFLNPNRYLGQCVIDQKTTVQRYYDACHRETNYRDLLKLHSF